jgi:hypothetical protein
MSWYISIIVVGLLIGIARHRMTQTTTQKTEESVQEREGDVKTAIASGDLDEMLKAVSFPSTPIDRHFLLQKIVEVTYKKRQEPETRKLFTQYARMHLDEFSNFIPPLEEQFGGKLPNVPTFKLFVISLEEEGKYDDAIKVCKQALEYGMDDETKTGFEGRIERIRRKQMAE